jgi:Leucine-rich repeat (LRR) protein
LETIDFSGIPASDATPLKGMPLKYIAWSGSAATDLNALRGAPMETLYLSNSRISDLAFVTGAPLQKLEISNAREVSDLRPLEGLPIRELALDYCSSIRDYRPLLTLRNLERLRASSAKLADISVLQGHPSLKFISIGPAGYKPVAEFWKTSSLATGPNKRSTRILDLAEATEVKSLEFARGLPLEFIDIRRTGIADLRPLAGMQTLKTLRVAGCPISDFSPIKGLPLTELRIGTSKFSDLSLLEGMPLITLTVDNCGVTDVAPLGSCKSLQRLVIPRGAKNIEALRSLPNLEYLSYTFNVDLDRPDKLASDFWAEYEAGKKQAK